MANLCTQTLSGINIDCAPSKGGIKKVYIANYSDVETVTVGDDDIITGITMNAEAKFKEYNFRKETGSMVSTLNKNLTNGTNYVSTVLSLVFTKMETAKRIEISSLSLGELAVIVEDGNGVFWYLGYNEYVSATNGSGNSGTAYADSNNYTIELTDISDTFPYEVSKDVISTII